MFSFTTQQQSEVEGLLQPCRLHKLVLAHNARIPCPGQRKQPSPGWRHNTVGVAIFFPLCFRGFLCGATNKLHHA